MADIIGKIAKIETVNIDEFQKNILTVRPNGEEMAFIECRNLMKRVSDRLKVGTIVSIHYIHQGSTSKKGYRFNNLVATSIKEI